MKHYEKPQIYFEKFELSVHIAACAIDMANSKTVDECSGIGDPAFGYPDGMQFFVNPDVCKDGSIDNYCYTNGDADLNIFNS